ncbi:MAG: transcriptional regulator [Nostocales cyanobacterium]|nr:MAG: transcriptional regulator [Nostocales cyanobacterium]TAF19318.1 MAG: transcriptional regulator [Nostocales cyanobacterium]
MVKSVPYHEFLISHLKDPIYAASYLETHLEDDGEEPDPRLVKMALNNVAEALSEKHLTPEQAKIHREKLNEILSQPGNEAIYNLAMWLNTIGLKLTVTVLEQTENHINHNTNNTEIHVS